MIGNIKSTLLIQSIIRSENAGVVNTNAISQEQHVELRHSVDPSTPSPSETCMIPYRDNHHAEVMKRIDTVFNVGISLDQN